MCNEENFFSYIWLLGASKENLLNNFSLNSEQFLYPKRIHLYESPRYVSRKIILREIFFDMCHKREFLCNSCTYSCISRRILSYLAAFSCYHKEISLLDACICIQKEPIGFDFLVKHSFWVHLKRIVLLMKGEILSYERRNPFSWHCSINN